MILQGGFNVTEWVDRNAHHPRPDQVLDQARQEFPGAFGSGKAMTAILSSAARKRHIRLARACWDHMDQAGMDKNVFHYNAMISVFEKDRKLGEALNLLKEMERKNISKNEVT